MELTNKIKNFLHEYRSGCKKSDDHRDSDLPHDIPEVERIDNLLYGPDEKWHTLDVYLPKKESAPFPVIINIHGGGWVYGTKETYQYYGMGLAKRGFAFINPNYRLAPEHAEFPDELDDVDRYMHWVDDHAEEYRLDRNNVFIIGDSAGGQMAEQYVTILTNPDYAKLFSYKPLNLKFRAVGLNCAASFVLTPDSLAGVESLYFTKNAVNKYHEQLDVEKYIDHNFLPTFLITANNDFLHDMQFTLFGFLLGCGVHAICKSYGDEDNPRGHVFFVNQKDKIADIANDEEIEFFRQHMSK